MGKPEGKRPLGRRPRCKWVDNIEMDLRDRMVWTGSLKLAQDKDQWRALVNTVMNLQVP
jgi:hypothetical protein